MPTHAVVRESNAGITPADAPRVAVFTGGTAGIGKATLQKLVAVGTEIKVYVIGRNGPTHAGFLDELRASNSKAEIVWLEGQVSLLSETRRLCDEIKSKEKSLDLLFMSAGYVPLGGRKDTSEGYDTTMAMSFWTRALLANQLLPLLRAGASSTSSNSTTNNNPRVISIYAAGMEKANIPLDDLDLKSKSNFGIMNWAATCASLNTVYLDHLASDPQNAGVVFIHNHPGVVETDIILKGWNEGSWGPTLIRWVRPVMSFFQRFSREPPISPEESGEKSLFLITSAMYGGKGVAVPNKDGVEEKAGGEKGKTLAGGDNGSVFVVLPRGNCEQPKEVLEKLYVNGGKEKLVAETEKVLKPYV
ncbi:uncharacterized protein B0I36DRAFT_387476 [Microdochium trichocladiopsis]|uniref:NAD(P)-binding protein n=1 Tax=Microdochium trichocladiopsis TaxID=1682393 RepID=A0A9P8XYZ3_9PEZI|nr:uncharacterized protein B0I36DRAFT_387476 [Microdochium trichocladiopsis]KAH7025114.1 hypothetical protein B0I36DRAFT_387476 [Microdochium trichocladiopsis]